MFFVVAILIACNNPDNTVANTTTKNSSVPARQLVFDRLVGVWQSDDAKTFERWSKNENGTYLSVVFSVTENDTSWKEQASIYPENDQWIFENKVSGQNDGQAVRFSAAVVGETAVQFSNPAHDFPTDIHYTVPDANTVNAFIAGPNKKGGRDTIPFNYKRIN